MTPEEKNKIAQMFVELIGSRHYRDVADDEFYEWNSSLAFMEREGYDFIVREYAKETNMVELFPGMPKVPVLFPKGKFPPSPADTKNKVAVKIRSRNPGRGEGQLWVRLDRDFALKILALGFIPANKGEA
jgi:hypothetical protein